MSSLHRLQKLVDHLSPVHEASVVTKRLSASPTSGSKSVLCAHTASEMQTRLSLRNANEKRMAAFDAGDIAGTMSMFLPTSKFIVVYPDDTPDLVMEGYDAIKELETGFMNAIAENFGKSYHEFGQWEWFSISEKKAVGRVYCKLWLTEKSTGKWNQVDLTGKSGRFWMEVIHVKVDGQWKLESQTAFSED